VHVHARTHARVTEMDRWMDVHMLVNALMFSYNKAVLLHAVHAYRRGG